MSKRSDPDNPSNTAVKRRPKVASLKSVGSICSELGRVYRNVRWGQISPADGVRLATILLSLCSAMETGLLEEKIEQLESQAKKGVSNVLT